MSVINTILQSVIYNGLATGQLSFLIHT